MCSWHRHVVLLLRLDGVRVCVCVSGGLSGHVGYGWRGLVLVLESGGRSRDTRLHLGVRRREPSCRRRYRKEESGVSDQRLFPLWLADLRLWIPEAPPTSNIFALQIATAITAVGTLCATWPAHNTHAVNAIFGTAPSVGVAGCTASPAERNFIVVARFARALVVVLSCRTADAVGVVVTAGQAADAVGIGVTIVADVASTIVPERCVLRANAFLLSCVPRPRVFAALLLVRVTLAVLITALARRSRRITGRAVAAVGDSISLVGNVVFRVATFATHADLAALTANLVMAIASFLRVSAGVRALGIISTLARIKESPPS